MPPKSRKRRAVASADHGEKTKKDKKKQEVMPPKSRKRRAVDSADHGEKTKKDKTKKAVMPPKTRKRRAVDSADQVISSNARGSRRSPRSHGSARGEKTKKDKKKKPGKEQKDRKSTSSGGKSYTVRGSCETTFLEYPFFAAHFDADNSTRIDMEKEMRSSCHNHWIISSKQKFENKPQAIREGWKLLKEWETSIKENQKEANRDSEDEAEDSDDEEQENKKKKPKPGRRKLKIVKKEKEKETKK